MPDLKFLPSIRDSETITCQYCNTRQYPRNGVCVKCYRRLELEYVIVRIDSLLSPNLEASREHLTRVIGNLLRSLRKRRGICQSQLAAQAGASITRTSLSKQECSRMLLPLHKLLRIAKALRLTAIILRFEGAGIRAVQYSTKGR